MPLSSLAHHRRAQGDFARALHGRQPPQDHGRAQRFGRRAPVLTIRNASQLFTTALLLGGVLPRAAQASRPAPGTAAHNAGHYAPVRTAATVLPQASTAAAGCLARPDYCPQVVAGTLIGATLGTLGGLWTGWHAASRYAPCAEDAPTPGTAHAEALRAVNTTAAALDDPPAALGFKPADLDTTQDPCESLYAYVNNRWANATRLDDGPKSRWHVTQVLQEQSLLQQRTLAEQFALASAPEGAQRVVADLWTSGMDAAHLNADPLRSVRAELAAIDRLDSPEAIAAHLRALTGEGRNPLFGFSVEPDMDNRTTLIAYAHQGGLGLPDPTDYHDVRRDRRRQDYWLHIVRLLQLSGVPEAQAHADATSVFSLEQRLAGASIGQDALASDTRLFYNPLTPAQADALTPHFSWSTLFQSLDLPVPDRFSLGMPNFHQTVSAALADTDPSAWRAYLRFHCLDMSSPYLSDDFARAAHEFQQSLVDLDRPLPPRWKRVLAAIHAFAGEALSEVYADAHFPPDTRRRITHMVDQIRTVLKRRLGTVPWLDAATRATAQARADQLDPLIGHPDHWPDWTGLRTERCGYLANLQRARAIHTRTQLARIGQPADGRLRPLYAHTPSAYFDVMQNDMAFSAALLQPPYFDPAADDALNYGAAGAIIGHEMAHAFTAETSQFAPEGGLRLWWSEQDRNRYAYLSRQLSEQFDRQQVDGLPVNGTLTAHENMADLGGLSLALEALRETTGHQTDPMTDGLSREQRFFISWALIHRRLQTRERLQLELQVDPHALGAPRANVAASNLPAFAEAFQCAVGTPMARMEHDRVVYL